MQRSDLYFLEGSEVLGGTTTAAKNIEKSVLDTTVLVQRCFDDVGKQVGFDFGKHCGLGKQIGVKFSMTADEFFDILDFIW